MDKQETVAVVALVAIGYADIGRAHQPGEAFEATEKDAASMVKTGHVILKADHDAQQASEAKAVLAGQEVADAAADPAAEPASDGEQAAAEPESAAPATATKAAAKKR